MIYIEHKYYAIHATFDEFVKDIKKKFEQDVVEFLVLSVITMKELKDGLDDVHVKTKFDSIMSMGFEWYENKNLAVVAVYDLPIVEEESIPDQLYAVDAITIPSYTTEEIDKRWITFIDKWNIEDNPKWKL